MNAHISYETAKRLKEFLGDGAVEPMGKDYYSPTIENPQGEYIFQIVNKDVPIRGSIPIYQLHDLLSRAFCEAMAETINIKYPCPKLESYPDEKPFKCHAERPRYLIQEAYWDGGLPSVEKALNEMMGGQNGK